MGYVQRLFEYIASVSPGVSHTLRNPAFGGSTSGGLWGYMSLG
jgi:hypothetical protein